jgi:hypothetical protein
MTEAVQVQEAEALTAMQEAEELKEAVRAAEAAVQEHALLLQQEQQGREAAMKRCAELEADKAAVKKEIEQAEVRAEEMTAKLEEKKVGLNVDPSLSPSTSAKEGAETTEAQQAAVLKEHQEALEQALHARSIMQGQLTTALQKADHAKKQYSTVIARHADLVELETQYEQAVAKAVAAKEAEHVAVLEAQVEAHQALLDGAESAALEATMQTMEETVQKVEATMRIHAEKERDTLEAAIEAKEEEHRAAIEQVMAAIEAMEENEHPTLPADRGLEEPGVVAAPRRPRAWTMASNATLAAKHATSAGAPINEDTQTHQIDEVREANMDRVEMTERTTGPKDDANRITAADYSDGNRCTSAGEKVASASASPISMGTRLQRQVERLRQQQERKRVVSAKVQRLQTKLRDLRKGVAERVGSAEKNLLATQHAQARSTEKLERLLLLLDPDQALPGGNGFCSSFDERDEMIDMDFDEIDEHKNVDSAATNWLIAEKKRLGVKEERVAMSRRGPEAHKDTSI